MESFSFCAKKLNSSQLEELAIYNCLEENSPKQNENHFISFIKSCCTLIQLFQIRPAWVSPGGK